MCNVYKSVSVEIENGVRRAPRLAPVIFRVLVLEKASPSGGKQVVVEEQFTQVNISDFEVWVGLRWAVSKLN